MKKPAGKEGYTALSTMCCRFGYALYRVKPKLHMQLHLEKHDRTMFPKVCTANEF